MSLMLGKEITGSKIIHTVDHEEEESNVHDILLDMESKDLCYLTLKLKRPAHEMDHEKNRGLLEMLNPFKHPEDSEKQTYLIPKVQIDRIDEKGVLMKGKKVEQERVGPIMDCRSYSVAKDSKVETESGKDLGKINDVVLDGEKMKLIALQMDEGSDGHNYLPYEDIVKWEGEKLIVEDSITSKFVGDPEQLTDHNDH